MEADLCVEQMKMIPLVEIEQTTHNKHPGIDIHCSLLHSILLLSRLVEELSIPFPP